MSYAFTSLPLDTLGTHGTLDTFTIMTQQEALIILKLGVNAYLTGSAGSGKTYLLDTFIAYSKWRGKNVGITASTGVAATHLSGHTLHSWAGIGIKRELRDIDISDILKRQFIRNRFRNTDILVIDEVSMLPSHTFEHVDRLLRIARNDERPFGGIQVILSGDFFQLHPISTGNTNPGFIYTSPLWRDMDLKVCYLEKPYRQDDKQFLKMLSEIRSNAITHFTWDTLKERFFQTFSEKMRTTRLYTHNVQADAINDQELRKIKNPAYVYAMRSGGSEILSSIMRKNSLAPERLILKKGALVMFVKNNFDEGYVNGTIGTVVDFTKDKKLPLVETFAGNVVKAVPAVWEIEEAGEVVAKIIQIPLRLAWAITIHKSQGMSLDAAEIDLGKSFVDGLGYVALSRVKSLQGIRLKSINRKALSVNDEVIKIDKTLQLESKENEAAVKNSYWYREKKDYP